jgi:hypothetical protein
MCIRSLCVLISAQQYIEYDTICIFVFMNVQINGQYVSLHLNSVIYVHFTYVCCVRNDGNQGRAVRMLGSLDGLLLLCIALEHASAGHTSGLLLYAPVIVFVCAGGPVAYGERYPWRPHARHSVLCGGRVPSARATKIHRTSAGRHIHTDYSHAHTHT